MADLLERNDQRRTERRDASRQHIAAERAPEAAYQRIVSHGRNRGLSDDGYALELWAIGCGAQLQADRGYGLLLDARGNLKRFVYV